MQATILNYIAPFSDKAVDYAFNHFKDESATAIYNIFENYVVHKACTDPQYTNHFFVFGTIFEYTSFAWILYNVKQVTDLQTNNVALPWLSKEVIYLGTGVLIAAAVGLIYMGGAAFLQKLYPSEKSAEELLGKGDIPKEDISNISLSWHRPEETIVLQRIYLTRVALNIALAYLSPNRFQYMISALFQAHSLLKISQMKWLKFSRTFDVEELQKKRLEELRRVEEMMRLVQTISTPARIVPAVFTEPFAFHPIPLNVPIIPSWTPATTPITPFVPSTINIPEIQRLVARYQNSYQPVDDNNSSDESDTNSQRSNDSSDESNTSSSKSDSSSEETKPIAEENK